MTGSIIRGQNRSTTAPCEHTYVCRRYSHGASRFMRDSIRDICVISTSCAHRQENGQCMLIARHVFPDVCKCSCPGGQALAPTQSRRAQGLGCEGLGSGFGVLWEQRSFRRYRSGHIICTLGGTYTLGLPYVYGLAVSTGRGWHSPFIWVSRHNIMAVFPCSDKVLPATCTWTAYYWQWTPPGISPQTPSSNWITSAARAQSAQ